MTAPARATARASSDRRTTRASTASSIVSGTCAERIARPSVLASSSSAASSSSIWRGMPSVRSYTALETSRGAGRPVPRMSVTTSAVSSCVRGLSRASSASRWLISLARHSRWIDPTGSSSSR